MKCIQERALAIEAAAQAGKTKPVEKAADHGVAELLPSQCHSNARKVADAREGKVVRGWIVWQRGLYVTHSIVEVDGVLYEVTPGVEVPYDFVAASDVADGCWSGDAEWSLIQSPIDGDPQTLLAG